MTTTWGEWRRMHPETVALSNGIEAPDDIGQPLGSPYDRDPFAGYASSLNQGRFAFPVSTEKLDDRLRPGDKVFAIEVGGRHKAYALTADSDWVVNEVVGGERLVVMARAQGPTAAAYVASTNGRDLSFRLNDGAIEDVETGSTWESSGVAVSGPMAGARLTAVPSRTSFWFSLVGALPRIELHQPE